MPGDREQKCFPEPKRLGLSLLRRGIMPCMTTPTGDTWPPTREQLAQDLVNVATVGVGRPLRGKAELKALALVAEALATNKALPELRQVEDAIRTTIEQLGDTPFARTAAWIFRTTDDPNLKLQTITDRRDRAADEMKCKVSTLEETYEPRMRIVIADALLKRLGDAPRPGTAPLPGQPGAPSEPSATDDVTDEAATTLDVGDATDETDADSDADTAVTKRSDKLIIALLGRRRPTVVLTVCILATGLAVGLALSLGDGRVPLPTVELERLAQESQHNLTGDQAPVPGTVSRTLGFGDPTPEGRTTYPYVSHETEGAGTPAAPAPTLDALTDVPFGIGDEREFLHLATGTTKKPLAIHITKRSVFLRAGEDLWLSMYLDNGASPEHNCSQLVGATIAQNTTVGINVWNSPNQRLHVIRGWIYASNAQPTWVTDAVAVITESPRTLEMVPRRGSQYTELPARYHGHIPLTNSAILQSAGMRLENNALLGSCWRNRVDVFLFFRQK